MESLISAYSSNKEITDYKRIFACSPEDAYMYTFLTSTRYTSCFATQFTQWVSEVQRSIPEQYHIRGTLHVVLRTGDFCYLDRIKVGSDEIKFLLKHYNPIVLWNKLPGMSLESALLFYKMIPDEMFFKTKGCLEAIVSDPRFEYTLQMDKTLTVQQLLSLASSLSAAKKKLKLVGPNYIGIVPLTDIMSTIDFESTIFVSRVVSYKDEVDWKRLEVVGIEIKNNDVGPYFTSRRNGVVLPSTPDAVPGKNLIDFGGDFSETLPKLYKKYGPSIVEQFVNYKPDQLFNLLEADIGNMESVPRINLHTNPDICPTLYEKLYHTKPDWEPKCHRSSCKDCNPVEYQVILEDNKRWMEREYRMYDW